MNADLKVEFNLIENAIDSLERAIDLLAWDDETNDARRLKQAILGVSHGVELLLKERLRRVHPALVWENVDKYPNLSARTVGVEGALSRLANIGGVTFSTSDIALIRSLRDTRKAVEHYRWATTKTEANTIVGKALGFAVFFSKKHLNYEFFGYRSRKDDTFDQLLSKSADCAAAYRERDEHSEAATVNAKLPCDFCNALAVDPANGACRICGHWNTVENSKEFDDDIPF